MRTIKLTTQAKKDYKRESKSNRKNFATDYAAIVKALANNTPLTKRDADHKYKHLKDTWRCHIYPDLAMIYSYPDNVTLRIERIGSHSELD